MSPDIDLLNSAQLQIYVFIVDEKVLFKGLFHSVWSWLICSIFMFIFMYASRNMCILEHKAAQVYYVSEKTLLLITSFDSRECLCYFSPSLEKSFNL